MQEIQLEGRVQGVQVKGKGTGDRVRGQGAGDGVDGRALLCKSPAREADFSEQRGKREMLSHTQTGGGI